MLTDTEQSGDATSSCADNSCPDRATLAQFAQFPGDTDDTKRLERHLSACPNCLNTYLDLCESPTAPRIPGIRVVGEIGRGRFGVVYKAWWLTDRPCVVALKILTVAGEMEINRFDREVAALRRIESPRIVKCLDAGVTGDAHYFVMDYVEGTHLDEFLRDRSESLRDSLFIFRRVCEAVADAHAHGVVHRDLKPRNILVDDVGEPYILDFGICAVHQGLGTSLTAETITRHGDVIGTLKYMSPEQAWGGVAGRIDERSDLWSLGIILYEIVTDGGYPYSLKGTAEKPPHEALLENIRKRLPELPRLDNVPDGHKLEVLIERCLTWEPENRITSAGALADDIGHYLDAKRIRTRTLGPLYRLKRLAVGAATRSRWTFAAAFVAAACALVWVSAFVFDVGWELTGGAVLHTSPAPLSSPFTGDVGDRIVVVGLGDESVPAVRAYAEKEGLAGVTESVTRWRGVHARLLERLRSARPAVIAWDYYFRSQQPEDAALIASVNALEEEGIPVTMAAYRYDKNGVPDLSPALQSALGHSLRHGAIVARDMVLRPGEFAVAVQVGSGTTVPSLALTTAAAAINPRTHLDVYWDGRYEPVRLMYEFEPGAYLRGVDRLQPTRRFEAGGRQPLLNSTDLVATVAVDLNEPEYWEARTVAYHDLLLCDPDRLRSIVQGKIVLIGDVRKQVRGKLPDRHPVRYGTTVRRDVPGCYLQADAIRGILSRRIYRAAVPPGSALFLSVLLFSMLGSVIPIRLARANIMTSGNWRRAIWSGLALVLVACYGIMLSTESSAVVFAGMAGVSLLVPLAGSLWVELARNRHRILDRNRRLIEGFGLDSAGTITVRPTRR